MLRNRWLYFAVHGTRAPRAARGKQRRGPARNWRYRAWIRTLPCAVCGTSQDVEAAHTGTDGGMQQRSSDWSCIPLCTDCHTMRPDSYHRIDGGREGFEQRHGISISGTVKILTRAWFAYSSEVK